MSGTISTRFPGGKGRGADGVGLTGDWIGYPGAREKVNFHFLARKVVRLQSVVRRATLRICAFTDYRLWINGRYVARGPVPGESTAPLFDTHDVTRLLIRGRNAMAVHCYNYGVGCHWQHRGPGGLIARLDVAFRDGASVSVGTDASWRVLSGGGYASNSPRMFWSMGFMEIFDASKEPVGWREAFYDDRSWRAPEVIGPALDEPWRGLQSRDIPLLREAFVPAVPVRKGQCVLPYMHAVSFRKVLPEVKAGIVYAETWVKAGAARKMILRCSCDDAFKVFLNGEQVLDQNYSEAFAGTRVWRGKDVYDQVHYAMTGRHGPCQAPVRLRPGWNRLTAVVDQCSNGWGLALMALDPSGERVVDLKCAAARRIPGQWTVAGPYPSTGLSDSLDRVATSLAGLPAGTKMATVDPFRYEGITDYADLMVHEKRSGARVVPDESGVMLEAGEYCIFDLGVVRAGYPAIRARTSDRAILDISSSNTLPSDWGLRLYQGGALKTVDRLYTAKGLTEWQPLHRRSGRYLHIACRKGSRVRLESIGMVETGYPVKYVGSFECSDPLLNRVWNVSRYTTQLVMQYGYQDCLRREQGTLNHQSFNYASRAAACCFGDTLLARRALRQAIANQYDNGWFDTHGISSPNSDDVTQCFSWVVYLREYLMHSGDKAFVESVFEPMENAMRFFAKMLNRHGVLDGRNMHVYRTGQLIYVDDACSYREREGYTLVDIPNSEIFGFSLMFYSGLKAAAEVAAALGKKDRAAYWRRYAERVRAGCNERFWDEEKGLYVEWLTRGKPCGRYHPIVQMYALFHGICEDHHRKRLLDFVVNRLGMPESGRRDYPLTTFNGYHYYMELLFRYGEDRAAIDLMRLVYGRWVQAGGTAFAEWFHPTGSFDGDRLGPEFEIHAYGTGAHAHFYENILGMRPVSPGAATVRIAPRTGGLRWAKGSMWTRRGMVDVSWKVDGRKFVLDVALPRGVACELDPPRGYRDYVVKVNGVRARGSFTQ